MFNRHADDCQNSLENTMEYLPASLPRPPFPRPASSSISSSSSMSRPSYSRREHKSLLLTFLGKSERLPKQSLCALNTCVCGRLYVLFTCVTPGRWLHRRRSAARGWSSCFGASCPCRTPGTDNTPSRHVAQNKHYVCLHTSFQSLHRLKITNLTIKYMWCDWLWLESAENALLSWAAHEWNWNRQTFAQNSSADMMQWPDSTWKYTATDTHGTKLFPMKNMSKNRLFGIKSSFKTNSKHLQKWFEMQFKGAEAILFSRVTKDVQNIDLTWLSNVIYMWNIYSFG